MSLSARGTRANFTPSLWSWLSFPSSNQESVWRKNSWSGQSINQNSKLPETSVVREDPSASFPPDSKNSRQQSKLHPRRIYPVVNSKFFSIFITNSILTPIDPIKISPLRSDCSRGFLHNAHIWEFPQQLLSGGQDQNPHDLREICKSNVINGGNVGMIHNLGYNLLPAWAGVRSSNTTSRSTELWIINHQEFIWNLNLVHFKDS